MTIPMRSMAIKWRVNFTMLQYLIHQIYDCMDIFFWILCYRDIFSSIWTLQWPLNRKICSTTVLIAVNRFDGKFVQNVNIVLMCVRLCVYVCVYVGIIRISHSMFIYCKYSSFAHSVMLNCWTLKASNVSYLEYSFLIIRSIEDSFCIQCTHCALCTDNLSTSLLWSIWSVLLNSTKTHFGTWCFIEYSLFTIHTFLYLHW